MTGLYNSQNNVVTTKVSGNSITGLYAADGSYNVVLDDGVYKGVMHPCGAFRVTTGYDKNSLYAPDGSLYRNSKFFKHTIPDWVLTKYGPYGPLPDEVTDFANNLHWSSTSGNQNISSIYSTTDHTAVPEYVQDLSGNWTSVTTGLPLSNAGVNSWEARTNRFLNSQVPATQTITVVNGSVYTVSVYGTASVVLSNAGSGTATKGSPVTFTAGSTSLVCTVSGAGGAFQNVNVELGAFATPPIVTAGTTATRAADYVHLTQQPIFGSSYSYFARATTPTSTNSTNQRIIGAGTAATDENSIWRNQTTSTPIMFLKVGNVTQYQSIISASAIPTSTGFKVAHAFTAGDQGGYYNGTELLKTSATILTGAMSLGIGSQAPLSGQLFNGQITDMAVWLNQRLPSANAKSLTGASW